MAERRCRAGLVAGRDGATLAAARDAGASRAFGSAGAAAALPPAARPGDQDEANSVIAISAATRIM